MQPLLTSNVTVQLKSLAKSIQEARCFLFLVLKEFFPIFGKYVYLLPLPEMQEYQHHINVYAFGYGIFSWPVIHLA